jgi:hypothetical protein
MTTPRIVNNLPQFTESVQRRAARGMTQALILGLTEASVLTPIATGTLLNSQFRDAPKFVRRSGGAGVVGIGGYSADYALPVHDPSNPQNFRRPSAEKEFLKKGFERAEPQIRAVLKGAIKV